MSTERHWRAKAQTSPNPLLRQGEKFRLRDLHDFLFSNGYVPMSLVRWEYLGLRDEVDALERLK